MNDIINKASSAINVWNEARNNSISISNYFNQGAYFQISKADFEIWEANHPENLHAYLGLAPEAGHKNFLLSLFCVDSQTDKKEVESHRIAFLTNLKQIHYKHAVIPNGHIKINTEGLKRNLKSPDNITPLDALTASIQWSLYKDIWVAQQEDLVQAFIIPFNDLRALFYEKGAKSAIVDFALKEEEGSFQVDLILWGYNSKGVNWHKAMDLVRPAPPFTNPSHFQLIQYALL